MARNVGASLKATLQFGAPVGAGSAVGSLTGTVLGVAPAVTRIDLGETIAADSLGAAPSGTRPAGSMTATSAGRTTVLPRRKPEGVHAVEERPRFESVRLLGEGGMGQVELARDNDIRRTVAVKRLHAEAQSEEAMLRFADEVRIVGQLEHPAIVPVYDVGRDDAGQVYLVMKHLNGETMEQIIEKLQEKDPAYVSQYSVERRVHLFLAVLDAIRYAHARGVIHRDLKPANIMIGPYGEVTVLDWGIAKPIGTGSAKEGDAQPLEPVALETQDRRLQATQLGSLAGTPLYMSPEQAAGRNDELDERSDAYSLCMVLFEWLALEHPLSNKGTVNEVLAAIISGDWLNDATQDAMLSGTPAEWVRVLMKGLVKEREKRFQSVAELEDALRGILDGHVLIECHVTLAKRAAYEFLAWIDRHPKVYTLLFGLSFLTLLGALGYGGYRVIHGLL